MHTFAKKYKIILSLLLFLLFAFVLLRLFVFHANVRHVPMRNAALAYYERGEGKPLIMLSGFGMTISHWDPKLLKQLSSENRLILIDYRGVGNSTGETAEHLDQNADDVISLMDALHIDQANVLGWSLGSFIAQTIDEKYPFRVGKLILVSTSTSEHAIESDSEKRIGNIIQQKLDGSWERTFAPFLFVSDTERTVYLRRIWLAQILGISPASQQESTESKVVFERALSDKEDQKVRDENLVNITAPTLLIAGAQDSVLPAENTKKVAQQIPNAKVYILDHAGHAVLFEKADQVARFINDFLR